MENSPGNSLMRKHQEGFTLLELIIIIIVLGVLAYFAIPLFLSQSKNAEEASFNYTLQSINTANDLYSMNQLASGQTITAHNPFDDIATLSNYAGTFSDVESTNCPAGYWAYQSGDATNGNWAVIVYRPIATLTQAFSYDGIQWIIYVENIVPDSSGKTIGLSLTEYPPLHQW